ncbi:MAG: phosphatase PAP2 family protein [Sutterellaceae bacterium]|nr:phosphatase PAP2 family protein [Sutterellaceae bacterium]
MLAVKNFVLRSVVFVDWELAILESIRLATDSDVFRHLMVAVSTIGNAGAVWIALAVVLMVFQKTRLAGLTVSVSLLLSLIFCNLTLKPAVERLRPCDISDQVDQIIACPSDFSFPSGHTSAAFAAAVAVMFFFPKYGSLALVLAAVMAFSRLFLFVHFPSDVLFGLVLGSTCALTAFGAVRFFCTVLLTKFKNDRRL